MVAPVNVVAEEKVVCFWRKLAAIKMVQQIFELAVDIAEDVDWRDQLEEYGLLEEDFLGRGYELANLLLLQNVR